MTSVKIIGTPLFQWESGRRVQIIPLRNMRVDSVHFSNVGDTEALVVKPVEEDGKIVANVPNVLLQSGSNLVVYAVNVSDDGEETMQDCVISVRKRPKPANYVYTETEVLSYTALEGRIRTLEESGLPTFGEEYEGRLLYVLNGALVPLELGEGLEIVEGVLRLTGTDTPDTEDDNESAIETVDNTAKLGIAKLGLMILGRE